MSRISLSIRGVLGAACVAAALTTLAAGCTSAEAPAIRVGTNTWPGYEPLYLAQDIGRLGPESATLTRHGSATEVLAAFRAGRIDAAALTLDEAMLLLGTGRDPCVVLVLDTSNGGDAIIARAGIGSVRELRGRRVGLERTALGAYMASRALQAAGLSTADVTEVNLPVDRHAGAFLSGAVDAVVTFEPVRSALLSAGGVEVFSSADIPGEIVDVLVVDRTFLTRHPDRVRQLVRGWFDALDYLERSPREAAGYMSPRLRLMPQGVLNSLAGLDFPDRRENRRLVVGDRGVPGLAASATRLAKAMRELDLLREDVRASALFMPATAEHPLVALGMPAGS